MRRGHGAHHDIGHFEVGFADAAQAVLNARLRAVHDMKFSFELAPNHPERTGHTLLSVDVVMLVDGMQEDIARRNTDIKRTLLDLLNVFFFDFVAIIRDGYASTVIEAFKMRSGDRSNHPADLAISLLLRFGDRLVEAKGD